MNIAKSAQASNISRNVTKGAYIRQWKFAGYDEAKEGLLAQQKEAEKRLAAIRASRQAVGGQA